MAVTQSITEARPSATAGFPGALEAPNAKGPTALRVPAPIAEARVVSSAVKVSADTLRAMLIQMLPLLPLTLFLLAFFFYPAIKLLGYSVLTQNEQGIVGTPVTAAHYLHFFHAALYSRVLWTTLRISVITSVLAMLLGFPVALVMARKGALIGRVITLVVIAPLIVSVVVRSYGWQLILGNGPTGVLNWVLLGLGLIHRPLTLLYTETAVVIGSLHVFFAMMVLPLASSIGKIDPNLESAAATLGAPWWSVLLHITLPLSLPGLIAGFTLVFSLTAGSLVTPALLGGTSSQMLGNLIQQQILTVYDWPFGATIAAVLMVIVLTANFTSMKLLESLTRRRPARRGDA
jgi:putative spermidine/putrescine transport system permease protein